ncbi:serine/threonine protein kinase [Nannizzia gypsea CBS 118893]|uniref:Serine/threonine protein kinase n=1 Tax=Arthroderma gypseum (strain ATCC MYA-4604 / CBS 118893) TaxID=535722 RepID=E5QYD5_ARTGP|nr:serine/threonine protein kinase [Nannizzia gypsea CBS 118893]EFQ97227.1 serine/threonine protein kinase [Nannizzia gypsea CBS 118893]
MAYLSPEPEDTKSEEYHTRVILLPISTSAVKSLKLPGNRDIVGSIPLTGLPIDPLVTRGRNKILAFRLYENLDRPYFVVGSDKSCQVQLQTTIDECWVNIRHCLFITIPDDKDDAVLLRNSSTSRFILRDVLYGQEDEEEEEILPGDRLRIRPGLMHITLGAGLEFLLKVLPSSVSNTRSPVSSGVCELLSGSAITAKSTVLRRKKAANKDPIDALHANKRIKSEASPSKTAQCEAWHPKLDLVAETGLTRVFKLQRFGRLVAAKVCRKPDIEDAVYMWENERKILQALKHRNIAQLLDFQASNLALYLEYIEGLDLSQYVDTDRFSIIKEEMQLRIWIDISGALKYIHEKGIIHHDIKPNNIILGNHKRGAVLCDFGLSTLEHRYSDGGSTSYVPPEMLLKQRGKPSDIWAFGVTMLFVFKHIQLPSNGWPIRKLMEDAKIRKKFMTWWDHIDTLRKKLPRRMTVLREMLTLDPQRRISASSLHDTLNRPRIAAATTTTAAKKTKIKKPYLLKR